MEAEHTSERALSMSALDLNGVRLSEVEWSCVACGWDGRAAAGLERPRGDKKKKERKQSNRRRLHRNNHSQ